MISHRISDSIIPQFCPYDDNFLPRIVHDKEITPISLIVADPEIELIIDKLGLLNLIDFPIHYIGMIVAGCISVVLKYPVKS